MNCFEDLMRFCYHNYLLMIACVAILVLGVALNENTKQLPIVSPAIEKMVCGISGPRFTQCVSSGCLTTCKSGELIYNTDKIVSHE